MNKSLLFFFFGILFLFSSKSQSQLVVNSGLTGAALVNSLVDATSASISNVVETCPAGARGSFTATGAIATKLGITTGIAMCTGNVTDLPLKASNLSSTSICTDPLLGAPTCPVDADLQTIMGTKPLDLCKIEFNIVPVGDTLSINYVFGSEEYYTYAPPNTSTYNDAFGFFLKGGEIPNYTNFALLNGTGTRVNVTSINPVTNSAYLVDNANGNQLIYTAFTKVLSAKIKVIPGNTYQIKMAIADASDHAYDSGILIKANSIKTVLPIELLSFTAKKNNNELTLQWSTASEKNNDHFDLERSADGINFSKIATIKGAGNSNHLINYKFTDTNPLAGNSYYRLRQYDYNAKLSLSKLLSFNNLSKINLKQIVPNPITGNEFQVQLNCPQAGEYLAEIIDITGKVIQKSAHTLAEGLSDIQIDASTLQGGTYFFRVQGHNYVSDVIKIMR